MKKIFLLLLIFSAAASVAYAQEDDAVAVVLSGGGARGAYQIGVWQAMIDCGIEIGGVYGVSVGAINGAVMAAGDIEHAEHLWKILEPENVMNINDSAGRLLSGDFSFQALFKTTEDLISSGGIDVSPLEELLNREIDEEQIRSSGVDFGLATFSIDDVDARMLYLDDIPRGRLVDYILASANFPLFQRKVIDGEVFIDGGMKKNMVVEMVDPDKFNRAVIISLGAYMPSDIRDIISGYQEYEIDVTFINPEIDLGSMLDFSPENAVILMKAGYLDGLSAFGRISGGRYYICGDGAVEAMYMKLGKDERRIAAELLEIPNLPDSGAFENPELYRELIEPELEILGMSGKQMLAYFAFRFNLPREHLYSEQELTRKISEKYINRTHSSIYHNDVLDFLSYLELRTDEGESSFDDPPLLYINRYNQYSQ